MHAKNQISLIRKTLYGIMLLGIFLSAFGAGNLSPAHAASAQSRGDIGTSFNSATALGITGSSSNSGQGIHGDFWYNPGNHYFFFTLDATKTTNFILRTNNDCSITMTLYAADHVTVKAQGQNYFLSCDQHLEPSLPAGNYYLVVYSGGSSNNYYLTWNYDGSTSSSAENIGNGFDESHDLEAYNDSRTNDWYYANWSGGQNLILTVDGDSGTDFDLYIYASTNLTTSIATATSTTYPDSTGTFTTPSSNKMYIKVVKYGGGGAYRLNVAIAPPPCYTLTNSTSPSGGGSVGTNPAPNCTGGKYTSGTVVTLTASPASGYNFSIWSGSVTGSTNPTTVTMNGDKSVTANFTQICYTLNASENPTGNGSVSVSPPPNCSGGKYLAGTQVTLTAIPATGAYFTGWIGDLDSHNNPETIIMNNNKTIQAYFPSCIALSVISNPSGSGSVNVSPPPNCSGGKYIDYTTVTLAANPASGYAFSNWSGDLTGSTNPGELFLAYNVNFSVTANFTPVTCYSLTTSVSPSGSGSVGASPPPNCTGGKYTSGTVVTLTATPASGYSFSSWSGSVTGSVNPTTVTMNGDKSVTANFAQVCYSLTTSVSPSGSGSVGVSPVANCTGGKYTSGTVVTLTATLASGYSFSSWSGSVTGSINPTTVTMNGDKSVTANFTANPTCYTLTTSVSPSGSGSVGVNPASNCTGGKYTSGTVVTLTATPASGYSFSSWSGSVTGSVNPTTATMNGDKSVIANYVQDIQPCYLLTMNYSSTGTGSAPTATPANSIGCSGGYFHAGELITMTPHPAAGYHIDHWAGTGSSSSNQLTMPANVHTVTAYYAQDTIVPALPPSLIDAADGYTCALRSDGSIVCWERNLLGQGTVPALPTGLRYTQVSANDHTCGLRSDGSLV